MGDINRSYGIQDMYRDISADDCMEFEKLLSKFESSTATFIHAIISGSNDISLSRAKLLEFKKFMFIMMYRNESRRGQYLQESFDVPTRVLIENHMRFNHIGNIQEVWFRNLKWIIKTPFEEIMDEVEKANSPMRRFGRSKDFADILKNSSAALREYNGPINSIELLDFSHLIMHYVCIWEAPEGSEFILTDNGFGNYEGPGGITLHNFFVISPRYVVVLSQRGFMQGSETDEILMSSWFQDLHTKEDNPVCEYVKENPKNHEDFSPEDIFRYKRIVIPKEK
ncbi:hypothetical protein BGZ49_003012, partial [Haplosporangium sp. Z 27]